VNLRGVDSHLTMSNVHVEPEQRTPNESQPFLRRDLFKQLVLGEKKKKKRFIFLGLELLPTLFHVGEINK
jgi:hypothetical protein